MEERFLLTMIKLQNCKPFTWTNKKNKFIRLGINGRMDTIQCAVVLQKLKLFKQEIILRNNVAKNYIQMLKKLILKI